MKFFQRLYWEHITDDKCFRRRGKQTMTDISLKVPYVINNRYLSTLI